MSGEVASLPSETKISILGGKAVSTIEAQKLLDTSEANSRDFLVQLRGTDMVLYEALVSLYHLYLLCANNSKEHVQLVNNLVRERLGKQEFDIQKEPSGNRFSNLLKATLLHKRQSNQSNDPKAEIEADYIPQRANTYSMALHQALKEKLTPDELKQRLKEDGVRKMRDKFVDPQPASNPKTDEAKEAERVQAIAELKEFEGAANLVFDGEEIQDMGLGVAVFLVKVEEVDGRKQGQLLRQAYVSSDTLKDLAYGISAVTRLEKSEAGPVIRCAQLAETFFDRAAKDARQIVIEAGDEDAWACASLTGDTEKPTKFLLTHISKPIEGLPPNTRYLLNGNNLAALYETLGNEKTAGNWRFERMDAEEKDEFGGDTSRIKLLADAVDGQKAIDLDQGSNVNIQPITVKAKENTGIGVALSAAQWIELRSSWDEKRKTHKNDTAEQKKQNPLDLIIDQKSGLVKFFCKGHQDKSLLAVKAQKDLPAVKLIMKGTLLGKLSVLYEEYGAASTRWSLSEDVINVETQLRGDLYRICIKAESKTTETKKAPGASRSGASAKLKNAKK